MELTLYMDSHPHRYEVEAFTRMFFHGARVTVAQGAPAGEGDWVHTRMEQREGGARLTAAVRLGGQQAQDAAFVPLCPDFSVECERVFAVLLHGLLTARTGISPGWGLLTGIRPVKLVHALRAGGKSAPEVEALLREKYLVTQGKAALALETAENEARVLARSGPQSYSLYVSVPFCPTRCAYCSFVSHSIEKTQKLVPEYVEQLLQEIAYAAARVREAGGLRLETVYIGGGTPTTLSAQQLARVMQAVNTHFGPPALGEFTVEAGRPDTITEEKLRVLKEYGATRISINPQTMDDGVLAAIGRRHTARQTEEAFALARKTGHACINMDLIAGLPTDTYEGFCATVERVLALQPENVTLHTLSVKRAAELSGQTGRAREQAALVERMLAYAGERFHAAGHRPYYLYRQKNTVGNMENVGWCREGQEGLYNVFIMDETHSIVALGAGGVTKLRRPGGQEHIERVFNFKYPYEYLSRFSEILARKDKIVEFYKKYPVK